MYTVTIKVSAEGTADCRTIKDALALANAYENESVRILVGKGVYREKTVITQPRITLQGCGSEHTVISWGDSARDLMPDGEKRGTFRTATLMVDADDFTALDITIENTRTNASLDGQAIALYADGDRAVFERCRITGSQDTVFTAPLPPSAIEPNGFRGPKEHAPRRMTHQYYRRCFISGGIDFIFGSAAVWFEDCALCSVDSDSYVTAASTPEGEPFGYVFSRCRFTSAPGITNVFLGRPWRDHAKVVLLDCELGGHIRPEGWHDWDKEAAHALTYLREYRSSGPGATGPRAAWAGSLGREEAAFFTPERVLGSWVSRVSYQ